MKIRKLLDKAKALLDPKERRKKVKKKTLKRVIKKLRKHEKGLLKKLKNEPSKPQSSKLTERIKLVHAQRKKGLEVLKDIEKS